MKTAYKLTDKAYKALDKLELPITGIEEFAACRLLCEAQLELWQKEYEIDEHPNPPAFNMLCMATLDVLLHTLTLKQKLFNAIKNRKSVVSTVEFMERVKEAARRTGDTRVVSALENAFPLLTKQTSEIPGVQEIRI